MTGMTATDVVAAVRRRFGCETDSFGPEWASLDELTGVGWTLHARADLFLVRAWSGRPKGHERIVVEVKVSRADLAAELANPDKLAVFAQYAHRTYFATPAGLVRDTDDLGPGVGLIEVLPGGGTRETRPSVRRPNPDPLPEQVVVEVFRRAARSETRVRTATEDDPAALVVELRARLAAAERAEQTARAAASRDARRLESWLYYIARHGGLPCTCGARMARSKDPTPRKPRHADGSPCPNQYGPCVDHHRVGGLLMEALGMGDVDEVPEAA